MRKKFIRGILMTVGILFLCMILFISIMAWSVMSNNKPKGMKEEKLLSKKQSPKKALIVYQPSISDFSSKIAHQIAKGLNQEGYEVTLNYPGENLSSDVSDYSIIVFGTPVYASHPSKVLIDYMSKINDYSSKRIVLYSVGSLKDAPELDTIQKALNGQKPYKKVKFFYDREKCIKDAYLLGRNLSKD